MATTPDVDTLVESFRSMLLHVPQQNRSGLFGHVAFMLEVWDSQRESEIWTPGGRERALAAIDRSLAHEETTTTPEDTLRAAGISSKRQARYQRRMSTLLGKGGGAAISRLGRP